MRSQSQAPNVGDKVLQCRDCGAEFVHSAADQEFYRERGFGNEPKRCPTCRRARKAAGGNGERRGGSGNSGGGFGCARQMYPATCASCGRETEVPFKPSGARPVYCRDCFQRQRGSAQT